MPTTRNSARTSARARAMQAAILAGARRLFLADGYERTNMDAVAAAIGVSKMTVYRHYRTKKALFTGVVGEMCDKAMANPELTRALAQRPLRTALEGFGRLALETLFAPEILNLHRLVIAECRRFPELGRMFYEHGPAATISTLAAYLARNANGRLHAADAERLAVTFLSLLRGYEHTRALLGLPERPSPRKREHQIARAVDYVLEKVS